jgi:phage/plasmid-like protein (TIGR03299 family)
MSDTIAVDHRNERRIEMRESTWSNLGHNVEGVKSLESVLNRSGLNYNVGFQPIHLPDGREVPNRVATVRESDGHIYDIVSEKYKIIQNKDAFDFVQYMGDDIEFKKAGETASGMTYIIAKLPDVNVLGDMFTPHVIFRNGFSGNVKITAAICPLRIICQNQFNFAFRNAENSITVRHVGNAEQKLESAKEVLKVTADFMVELNAQAELYAKHRMTKPQVEKVLDVLFPIDPNKELNAYAQHMLDSSRSAFVSAYEHEDNTNFRGTAWGLVNAYSDFITHKKPMGKTDTKEENRFMTTVFHPGMMNTIFQAISVVAPERVR